MDNPTTPDVTPETRDNLLKTLEANATEAIACLRTIQSSLANRRCKPCAPPDLDSIIARETESERSTVLKP